MFCLGCFKSIPSSTVIQCFAASVRKVRHGLEISQEELAERADLHRTYIAGIERGAQPQAADHQKAGQGLGVSVADLLSETKCDRC
jgi:transcriptional regulator with XRE-family HTH domain